MKRKRTGYELAKLLNLPPEVGIEAVMKAQMITAVLAEVERTGITHAEIARRSGIPRSAVTGMLSGSLLKFTLDRVLRLVVAVGLTAEVKLRKAA